MWFKRFKRRPSPEVPPDPELRSALIQSIREAFDGAVPLSNISNFVTIAAERDPRLYSSKTIPDEDLRELWNFADSYFDAVSTGDDNVQWGLNILEAGSLLKRLTEELEATGSVDLSAYKRRR